MARLVLPMGLVNLGFEIECSEITVRCPFLNSQANRALSLNSSGGRSRLPGQLICQQQPQRRRCQFWFMVAESEESSPP
jgi:hypothetical protein